ncbi:MAG: PilZ domain-containing protein [Elusimicrobiota bacterium]
MFFKKDKLEDLRKYVRIPTVIPVEFAVVNDAHEIVWQTTYQGYTRNINQGGVCLEVSNLDDNLSKRLSDGDYLLKLSINLPTQDEPIIAYVSPRWVTKIKQDVATKFRIGVAFHTIADGDKNKIIKYVDRLKKRPRQAVFVISFLALIAGFSVVHDLKVQYDNKRLIQELSDVTVMRDVIDTQLDELNDLRLQYEEKLDQANLKLESLQEQFKEVAEEKIDAIEGKIRSISTNKDKLRKTLEELIQKEQDLQQKKSDLKKAQGKIDKKNAVKMFNWIKSCQNARTGLVPSYEGDPDLSNFAFTYDQALAIDTFIINENLESAKKILDFYVYRARKSNGGFLNAYDSVTEQGVEWSVHVGPNAWLAMSAVQYYDRTNASIYLDFAEDIGRWILGLQDKEGGIKGGPATTWYSTEHNIDAYALFRMLYITTNNVIYRVAADRILEWIRFATYNESEKRLNRGKNDFFVATDVVSFGLESIGPKRFLAVGINPDDLIDFVEKNTEVTAEFTNTQGKVLKISGFDYTNPSLIGRQGIVSSEWTAQMIIAYQIMARYYESADPVKSSKYAYKAQFFMSELDKMLIMQPYSKYLGGGLPYATGSSASTGHGWITPKSPFAISVAGTAYALLARKEFNPFRLASDNKFS